MNDREFLSFCIVVIQFFKKSKNLEDSASHLINCLNCSVLLRDEFEKMLRILLWESKARNLDLIQFLEYIKELRAEAQIIELEVNANKLQ